MCHLSNPWLCNIRLPLLDCFYTPVIYENLCSLRMFYVVKDTVFWAVIPHSLVEIYRHFRQTCSCIFSADTTFKIEEVNFSHTVSEFLQTVWSHYPKHSIFHSHCHGSLKNLHIIFYYLVGFYIVSEHRIEVAGLACWLCQNLSEVIFVNCIFII
jgi:hypothetical protein